MSICRRMLFAVASLAPLALAGQQVPPATPSEIRVTGTSEQSVRPDVAVIMISFNATARTPAEAARRIAARADSLRRAFESIGIPRDSLITRSQTQWWLGRMQAIPGAMHMDQIDVGNGRMANIQRQDTTYRAGDAFEAHIPDVRKLGAVIDTAFAHDVVDVGQLRFVATDVTAAQVSALRDATVRAKRQAQAIAEAAGGTLGRLLSVTNAPDYNPDPFREVRVTGIAQSGVGLAATPGTEVTQPNVPVRVTISARWEFVPRP